MSGRSARSAGNGGSARLPAFPALAVGPRHGSAFPNRQLPEPAWAPESRHATQSTTRGDERQDRNLSKQHQRTADHTNILRTLPPNAARKKRVRQSAAGRRPVLQFPVDVPRGQDLPGVGGVVVSCGQGCAAPPLGLQLSEDHVTGDIFDTELRSRANPDPASSLAAACVGACRDGRQPPNRPRTHIRSRGHHARGLPRKSAEFCPHA